MEARNARVSEFQIVDGWCNVMAEHQDDDGSPPSFINLLPPCPPFLLLRAWSYGGGGGEVFMVKLAVPSLIRGSAFHLENSKLFGQLCTSK